MGENIALFERAKTHLDRDEVNEAAKCLTEYLNTDFWSAEAAFMLGYCELRRGNPGLGAILNKQAVQTKPQLAEAWRNLGAAFKDAHKNAEAVKAWKEGLKHEKIPGERARLYASLGTAHINEGSPEKAMEYFREAQKLDPHDPSIKYNRGLALLELGQWEEGFAAYEQRFASGAGRPRHYGSLSVWDGSPDKRVIVWGEQGIGDEILFASCIPDLIKISRKVIFDCHPRMVELFKRSFPGAEIYGTRKLQSGVPWDHTQAECHVSISTLPHHFRKRDADFNGAPFLKADMSAVKKGTKPNIGLSWRGGTGKTRIDLRSITLEQFVPILQSVDADFYSLQYTPEAAQEVLELEERTGIRIKHYPGWVQCKDYDKTASFFGAMDLVITVCTAAHHLAGALGVPCWTLVPTRPAWRYGLTGEKCIWYDSVRLIRQTKDGVWSDVIDRVAQDIRLRFGDLSDAA